MQARRAGLRISAWAHLGMQQQRQSALGFRAWNPTGTVRGSCDRKPGRMYPLMPARWSLRRQRTAAAVPAPMWPMQPVPPLVQSGAPRAHRSLHTGPTLKAPAQCAHAPFDDDAAGGAVLEEEEETAAQTRPRLPPCPQTIHLRPFRRCGRWLTRTGWIHWQRLRIHWTHSMRKATGW